MTPFGKYLRQLRSDRGISQKDMAAGIGVTAAYLSALEHGHRGKPSWVLLQRIVGFLNIIWDDADHLQVLAKLSDPKPTIDTRELSAEATLAANLLAQHLADFDDTTIAELTELIRKNSTKNG